MTIDLRQLGVESIVLDIEGTTTPIAFVYDVLFPYARERLREHVKRRRETGKGHTLLERLRAEWSDDVARGDAPPLWPSADAKATAPAVRYLEWLMDRDRKSFALKALQGEIWERGYRDGALRGQVFPDVAPAFERWRAAQIGLAIYSSGSELAQRLLFSTTSYGDLTGFITRFFDTAVGPKTSPESYARVASELARRPDQLLFISDVVTELDAAHATGYNVALCVRSGNRPQPVRSFAVVETFDDVT